MLKDCGIIWFQMNFIFTFTEMTIFLRSKAVSEIPKCV